MSGIIEQFRCAFDLEVWEVIWDTFLTKVDRSEELEGLLERVLQNTEDLKNLSKELGVNVE